MQQAATKWADYVIVAVRYDWNHSHITDVKLRTDNGTELGFEQIWSRQQVVAAIERYNTFVTATLQPNSNWKKGEDVRVVLITGIKYIRTDNNRTAADNLGSLPEF